MPTDFFAEDVLDDFPVAAAPEDLSAGRGAGGEATLTFGARSLEGTRLRLFDGLGESEKREKSSVGVKKEKTDVKELRQLFHLVDAPGVS
eukprot:scaffold16151_cov98-Cylindrotheca_fusiformis.AAC.1